jgi:hypothetical protein
VCRLTLKYFSGCGSPQNVCPGVADGLCRPLIAHHRYGQYHCLLKAWPATMFFHLITGHLRSSYLLHRCRLYFHLHQDSTTRGHHPLIINMIARLPISREQVCTGAILLYFIWLNKCIAGNGSCFDSTSNSPPWWPSSLLAVNDSSSAFPHVF